MAKASMKDKVSRNSHKQKVQGSTYGYLMLPTGVELFKEEAPSRIKLDIMPYVVTSDCHPDRDDELGIAIPGELWYKRPFFIHRDVGADNEVVVCPSSVGKPCPICRYRQKRSREGAEKEELDVMRFSKRNLYVVIPIDNKEYEEKPHLWDISQFLFQNQLNDEIDEDPELAGFPDLEDGLSLRIRFVEGSFKKNKFAETSRIDFVERDKPYNEKILKIIPNLDDCLRILPYDQLEAKFLEQEGAQDEDVKDYADPEEEQDKDEDRVVRRRARHEEAEEPAETSEEEKCIACEGSGKNSRGKTCRICKGTGIKPDRRSSDDDRGEERSSDEKVTRRRRAEQKEDSSASKKRCPFGHTFGSDCEKFRDCEDCDEWDDCIILSKNL